MNNTKNRLQKTIYIIVSVLAIIAGTSCILGANTYFGKLPAAVAHIGQKTAEGRTADGGTAMGGAGNVMNGNTAADEYIDSDSITPIFYPDIFLGGDMAENGAGGALVGNTADDSDDNIADGNAVGDGNNNITNGDTADGDNNIADGGGIDGQPNGDNAITDVWLDEMGCEVDDGSHTDGEQAVLSGVAGNAHIYEYLGAVSATTPVTVRTDNKGNITISSEGKAGRFGTNGAAGKEYGVFLHEYDKTKYNRSGSYADKVNTLRLIKSQGWQAEDALRFMFGRLVYDMDKWAVLNLDAAPVDARITFRPDSAVKFGIKKERAGYRLEREGFFELVLNSYISGQQCTADIIRLEVKAAVTAKELALQTHYRAGFSTSYSGSSEARKHNVRLALRRFNGYMLAAGRSVSFNAVVGTRSRANGFLEAKIILNGRFEDGVGGGVCQSSTTMYNAALLADMTVTAVRPHSLRVGYIEPSFDAMVNAGGSDLVFRNDTERPVYIRTYSNEGRVYVEFYGLKMPYLIKRRSETIKTIPSKQTEIILDHKGEYLDKVRYKGERHYINYPKDGLHSKGYLQYYQNGRLLKEKHIRTDKYHPLNGRIVEGVLDRPAGSVTLHPSSE